MDPNKLRQERAAVLAKAEAIVARAEEESRSLTEDEVAEINGFNSEADRREAEIKAIEDLNARRIAEREKEIEDETPSGDGGFRSLGEFVHTALNNPRDPRLRTASDLGLSDMPDALVPEQYATTIMQLATQASIVEPRATVFPPGDIPDGSINIPAVDYREGMYGGAEVTWIDEGGLKPKTDVTLTDIKLTPAEVAAHVVVTDKLLRNAPAVETLLNSLLAKCLAAAKDHAFMSNVGSPTPILGHDATLVVPRDTESDISYGDIVQMYSQFIGNSGVWVCANTALPVLMQMEDSAKRLIWQANAAVAPTGTILGDPLLKSQRQPTLGNEGDIGLFDFSQYLIKRGSGLFIGKSEHVYYTNNKTVVKIFELVDGSPWLKGTVLLEDGETEASPFVVLGDVAS